MLVRFLEDADVFIFENDEFNGVEIPEGTITNAEMMKDSRWIIDFNGIQYWQYNYSIEDKIERVTYTDTEEGKDVLNLLSNIISTSGMEVYKCDHCEELYGSQPELALYDEKPTCGICQGILKRENSDSHGLESLCEDDFEEEKDLELMRRMQQYEKSRSSREE